MRSKLHSKLSNISNFAKDTKLIKHTNLKAHYLLREIKLEFPVKTIFTAQLRPSEAKPRLGDTKLGQINE